ncbi:MAG: hypothetical protein ACT4RN_02915 [Pseudonocardia sp.]
MDKDRLAYGRYVVWNPPPDLTVVDLEPGHPGIIVGPFWQDVEVNWLFRESEPVSQHVYHYDWLREVDAAGFLEAANRIAERMHNRDETGEK